MTELEKIALIDAYFVAFDITHKIFYQISSEFNALPFWALIRGRKLIEAERIIADAEGYILNQVDYLMGKVKL
jgi:hypothetical protein